MTIAEVKAAVQAAASRYGVDPALALAVAERESAFRPDAVSSAGAIGVMQLMPGTAAELGVDPWDPLQNIDGGVRYLRQQLQRFGDVSRALAAYNFGPGNVSRGRDWPAETRNYVSWITQRIGLTLDPRVPSVPTGEVLAAGFNFRLDAPSWAPVAAGALGLGALAYVLLSD